MGTLIIAAMLIVYILIQLIKAEFKPKTKPLPECYMKGPYVHEKCTQCMYFINCDKGDFDRGTR